MARKVLIAIELDERSADVVLSKAKQQLSPQDECHIVYVLDPADLKVLFEPSIDQHGQKEYETRAMANAQARLQSLIASHDLPNATVSVGLGRIAAHIRSLIATESFDCLMIGSHGWHGWQRLLGSHAAAIVNQAGIDVWVFKIPS